MWRETRGRRLAASSRSVVSLQQTTCRDTPARIARAGVCDTLEQARREREKRENDERPPPRGIDISGEN